MKPKVTPLFALTEKDTDKGRTILLAGGEPVLMELVLRPATSAPEGTRTKAMLAVVMEGDDGDKIIAPMPFATATVGPKGGGGFTPEFRMESN